MKVKGVTGLPTPRTTLPCFCSLCDVSKVDEVITDFGIRAEALSELKSTGCKVTLVNRQ